MSTNSFRQPDDTEILISFLDSYEAKAISLAENLIHRSPMLDLLQRVSSVYARIRGFKKQLDYSATSQSYHRVHEVISVHGRRGAGKTTFILSALHLISDRGTRGDFFAQPGNLSPADVQAIMECCDNVHPLDIVDPTLLGSREHLFMTVLQNICSVVERERKNRRARCAQGEGAGECEFERWYKSLRRLGKGLQAIGEGGTHGDSALKWDDPHLFMEKQLDHARHGDELERDFHRFLNESLTLIGKQAFVLALDDIDTRPSIGWHVLEIIRKYFTSPQLIIILSGDIDLYTTVIRNKHLEEFKFPKKEDGGLPEVYENRIETLVDQYLVKILRSSNRLAIPYFLDYVDEHGMQFNFTDGASGPPVSLDELLDTFHQDVLFLWDNGHKHDFRSALLDNPCRTVLQFLQPLYEFHNKAHPPVAGAGREQGAKPKAEPEPAPAEPPLQATPPTDGKTLEEARNRLVKRIATVCGISLQRLGFPYVHAGIKRFSEIHGVADLLAILLQSGIIDSGVSILPRQQASWKNTAIIAIHVALANALRKKPWLIFHYGLVLGLFHELWVNRGILRSDSEKYSTEEYLQHILAFLDLASCESSRQAMGNIAGLAQSNGRDIRLPGVRLAGEPHWTRQKYASFAQIMLDFELTSRRYDSIFSLIALLGDILAFAHAKHPTNEDDKEASFLVFLGTAQELRNYPVFMREENRGQHTGETQGSLLSVMERFGIQNTLNTIESQSEEVQSLQTAIRELATILARNKLVDEIYLQNPGSADSGELFRHLSAVLEKYDQAINRHLYNQNAPANSAGKRLRLHNVTAFISRIRELRRELGESDEEMSQEIEPLSEKEIHSLFLWTQEATALHCNNAFLLFSRSMTRFLATLREQDKRLRTDANTEKYLLHCLCLFLLATLREERQSARGGGQRDTISDSQVYTELKDARGAATRLTGLMVALGVPPKGDRLFSEEVRQQAGFQDFARQYPLFSLIYDFPLWRLLFVKDLPVFAQKTKEQGKA